MYYSIMDIASSAKAALYGSIWPSHGVQRARNSRVTHHVGHSRNINNPVPTLLRLKSVGEVSSDGKSADGLTSNYKMTPKIALAENCNGKSKILDRISHWISFGSKLISSGGVSSKMGLADSRSAGLCIPVLEEMFSGHMSGNSNAALSNVFTPQVFRMFPFSESKSNKLPAWMAYSCQQNMVINGFNNTPGNTLDRGSDSPWNKFYSEWKTWNTTSRSPSSDCNTCENAAEGKGQKRVLEDASDCITDKLTSCFQDLSLHNNLQPETPLSDVSQTMAIQNVENHKTTSSNSQSPAVSEESKCGHCSVDFGLTPASPKRHVPKDIAVKATRTDLCKPSGTCKCSLKGEICKNNCFSFSVSHDASGKTTRTNKGRDSGEKTTLVCTKMPNKNLMPSKDQCRKPKRGRPSAKKRRRKKARQYGSCSFDPVCSSDGADRQNQQAQKKCRFEKVPLTSKICNGENDSATAKVKNSSKFPVSFILGVNELDEGECASDKAYEVSVVMEGEESAFSEEDTDYDCDNFDIYKCDFLPFDGDFFNPINFTMSISVSKSTQDSTPQSPFQTVSPYLDIINASWGVSCDNSTYQSRSPKKVRFAAEDQLTTVHPMIAWSHAYQSARKGPWEQYARDRQRFQRRVEEAESFLSPILDAKHRQTVYLRLEKNS